MRTSTATLSGRLACAALIAMLTACGGGGSSGSTPSLPGSSGPNPVASPAAPVTIPASASSSVTVNPQAAMAVTLPSTTTLNGGVTFPAASNATSANVAWTLGVMPTLPASVSPLAHGRRVQDTAGTSLIGVIEITSPVTLTFSTAPAFALTVPAASLIAGDTYYLGLYDAPSNSWNLGFEGPAIVSGTNLAFASNGAPFTLAAATPAIFALFGSTTPLPSATSTPSPTTAPTTAPTPVPTPIPTTPPTPIPAGAVVLAPPVLDLDLGAPTTSFANATVSQSGAVNATYSVSSTSDPAQCTVAPTMGTVATLTISGTTLTAQGVNPGTCTWTIASSVGGSPATLTAMVRSTTVTISGHKRT